MISCRSNKIFPRGIEINKLGTEHIEWYMLDSFKVKKSNKKITDLGNYPTKGDLRCKKVSNCYVTDWNDIGKIDSSLYVDILWILRKSNDISVEKSLTNIIDKAELKESIMVASNYHMMKTKPGGEFESREFKLLYLWDQQDDLLYRFRDIKY